MLKTDGNQNGEILYESFENHDSGDELIEVAKVCLEASKSGIIFRELFEYDVRSWFVVIFSDQMITTQRQLEQTGWHKCRLKIQRLPEKILNNYVNEARLIWGKYKERAERIYNYSELWGYHYDDIHNLGILDKMDGSGELGRKASELYTSMDRTQLSNLELNCLYYLKYIEVPLAFEIKWVDIYP